MCVVPWPAVPDESGPPSSAAHFAGLVPGDMLYLLLISLAVLLNAGKRFFFVFIFFYTKQPILLAESLLSTDAEQVSMFSQLHFQSGESLDFNVLK